MERDHIGGTAKRSMVSNCPLPRGFECGAVGFRFFQRGQSNRTADQFAFAVFPSVQVFQVMVVPMDPVSCGGEARNFSFLERQRQWETAGGGMERGQLRFRGTRSIRALTKRFPAGVEVLLAAGELGEHKRPGRAKADTKKATSIHIFTRQMSPLERRPLVGS